MRRCVRSHRRTALFQRLRTTHAPPNDKSPRTNALAAANPANNSKPDAKDEIPAMRHQGRRQPFAAVPRGQLRPGWLDCVRRQGLPAPLRAATHLAAGSAMDIVRVISRASALNALRRVQRQCHDGGGETPTIMNDRRWEIAVAVVGAPIVAAGLVLASSMLRGG
jgi:hypothetical protein